MLGFQVAEINDLSRIHVLASVGTYREIVVHDEVKTLGRFPFRIRGKTHRAGGEGSAVQVGIWGESEAIFNFFGKLSETFVANQSKQHEQPCRLHRDHHQPLLLDTVDLQRHLGTF